MPIEQQVHIGDGPAFDGLHGAPVDQMLGRDQHFRCTEHKVRQRVPDQNAMLRRQHQRAMIAECSCCDTHRSKSSDGGNGALPAPAQRLQSMIHRPDHVSGREVLDPAPAVLCFDKRPGYETGNRRDGYETRVDFPIGACDVICEIDGLKVGVRRDGQSAIGIQRDDLACTKRDTVTNAYGNAIDVGDEHHPTRQVDVVVEHVQHLGAVSEHADDVRPGDEFGLNRVAGNQQVGIVVCVRDVCDPDPDRIHLARIDQHGHRQGDGKAVHFRVVIVARIVLEQVDVRCGVQVGRVDIAIPGDNLDLLAIDPDTNEILIDRVRELRIFLGRKHEPHGHHTVVGNEVDVEKAGVERAGPGGRVEIRVVVRTAAACCRCATAVGVATALGKGADLPS